MSVYFVCGKSGDCSLTQSYLVVHVVGSERQLYAPAILLFYYLA
jgi:hypothetical protein